MTYEVEWKRKDNVSGAYLVDDDEKEFISFIKYCLKQGHEIVATEKRKEK